jgi:kynurenine formamidase
MPILPQLVAALATGRIQVVDLTQPLSPETPVIELPPPFANSPGVTLTELSRFDERGPAWTWNVLHLGEHTGTHFDAPGHWITGKDLPDNTCDTIPPARFIGPACVIDVEREVAADADFLVTPERIGAWEADHGPIPAGAWVLLRSGWSRRRGREAFLNVGLDGPHSPGFSTAASRLLAHERDVLGVGVETVGTDAGQAGGFDPPFSNHAILHGVGKLGLASLTNLDRLPPTGAVVIAAPLKIVGGSGSPLRVLALVEG